MRWALAAAAWGIELREKAAEGAIKVDADAVHAANGRMEELAAGSLREDGSVTKNRVAVGVLSSRKMPYDARLQAVRATWAASVGSFKAYTFDEGTDTIYRRTLPLFGPDEAHSRATGLNLAMIPAMLDDFPDAEWLVQVDDDTMLFPGEVLRALEAYDSAKPLLMGMCSRWPWHPHDVDGKEWGMDEEVSSFSKEQWDDDGFHGPFVVGGGGIFMSRAFAEGLRDHALECRRKYNAMMYGDVRVAACAKDVYGREALGTFGAASGFALLDGASQERLSEGGIVRCLPGATVMDAAVHFNLKSWTVKGPQDEGFAELHPRGEAPLSISLKDPGMMKAVWKQMNTVARGAKERITWERVGDAINKAEGEQYLERPGRHRPAVAVR